ncbi:hypothetical protein Hanom_Chr14g01265551 [Helianthus anomalus]
MSEKRNEQRTVSRSPTTIGCGGLDGGAQWFDLGLGFVLGDVRRWTDEDDDGDKLRPLENDDDGDDGIESGFDFFQSVPF